MKRHTILLALAVAVQTASAQTPEAGAVGYSLYAGAIRSAYDVGADGSRTGPLVGLSISRPASGRSSLFANVAYARTSDVGSHAGSNYFRYDDSYRLATVGGEYAVIRGPWSVWVSVEAGARWRRTSADDPVGSPTTESERGRGGSSVGELIVPGLTLRREIMPRGALTIAVRDYIMSLEAPKHSPGVLLGFTIR